MPIVSDFLEAIGAIHHTGSATPGTAFYPPLSALFKAIGEKLKPKVLFLAQLKDQSAGMRDGGFYAQPRRSPPTRPRNSRATPTSAP